MRAVEQTTQPTIQMESNYSMERIPVFIAVLTLFGVVFFSTLFLGEQFGYRDSGHFYYPLFQYIQSQWDSGQVPLWNPLENCGAPLLADPVASVFYPGKLLFFLPVDYPVAYRMYIWLHLLLCAATAYGMARCWGSSILAAGVCGISYAFSGTVLMQYSNVVFLVGAAWIPVALVCAERAIRLRSWRATVGLGVVLALQVLGGDPQAAYLCGLLGALYALGLWIGQRRELRKQTPANLRGAERRRARQAKQAVVVDQRIGWLQHRGTLLAMAATISLLLSLVQVVPSWQLARRSSRAFHELPRNIYELPMAWAQGDARPIIQQGESRGEPYGLCDALVGAGPPGGVRTYRYSTGPWRWLELFWPNITGQPFPSNQHWPLVWPEAVGVWTPTLYLGLLPILLGLGAVRLFRAPPKQIWLSWIMLFGLFGALGAFGLVWAGRLVLGTDFGGQAGGEVGGLYWLLTVLLPGFVNFRYPSKLLVFMAIGMSGLAAIGWDRLLEGSNHALRRMLIALVPLSLLGFVLFSFGASAFEAWLTRNSIQAIDAYYGPLDIAGARWSIQQSLLHTAVVALLGFLLCVAIRAQKFRRLIPIAMMALIVVDLAVANQWIVQTVPQSNFDSTSHVVEVIRQAEAKTETDQPFRIYRPAVFFPIGWGMEASDDRMKELFQWSRNSLKPKHGLAYGLEDMAARGAMDSHDHEYFYAPWPTLISSEQRRQQPNLPAMTYRYSPLAFDMWNVKYFVLPKVIIPPMLSDPHRCITDFTHLPSGTRAPVVYEPPQDQLASVDYQVVENPDYFPRAWTVQNIIRIPPITGYRTEERTKIFRKMLKDQQHDLHNTAYVESEDVADLQDLAGPASGDSSQRCRYVRQSPDRVEIEVDIENSGLLVLAETYCSGWRATVDGNPATIFRTNRMMRGVVLPAGQSRVVFTYEPSSFWLSAAVSFAAWVALLIGTGVCYRYRE